MNVKIGEILIEKRFEIFSFVEVTNITDTEFCCEDMFLPDHATLYNLETGINEKIRAKVYKYDDKEIIEEHKLYCYSKIDKIYKDNALNGVEYLMSKLDKFSEKQNFIDYMIEINKKKEQKPICKQCSKCHVKVTSELELSFKCNGWGHHIDEYTYKNGPDTCSLFDSKYIKYPIKVSGIQKPKEPGIIQDKKAMNLVGIMPCDEKYNKKTFLGIYLGDISCGICISHNRITEELEILNDYNPAIYVPELNKIVWGYESYWYKIDSEEKLKNITDDDINNTWYVKLLKDL